MMETTKQQRNKGVTQKGPKNFKNSAGQGMDEQSIVQIKEQFDYLYLNRRSLSASEMRWVDDLKAWYKRNKELSEKQQNCLFGIYAALKTEDN